MTSACKTEEVKSFDNEEKTKGDVLSWSIRGQYSGHRPIRIPESVPEVEGDGDREQELE